MRPKSNVRCEARIATHRLPAILLCDHRVSSAWVIDLSRGGAKLRMDGGPPVGAQTEINFSGGRRDVIRATASVVHRDDKSVSISFSRLSERHGERLERLIADYIFEEQRGPWEIDRQAARGHDEHRPS